jgi:hypothetical protein
MLNLARYRVAAQAAGIHSLGSMLVAALAAWVVFGVWYAYPYRELSGGRELFLLVIAVDVVCGPLLTLVLFSPKKPRKELWMDLGLVALIQFAALGYGMWTVWQARPLYLVHEVDRYKVISAPDVKAEELEALPASLKPQFWAGPRTVSIRPPQNAEEHNTVLFEAAAGGRDYGSRPGFYIPYEGTAAVKSLLRAKPLSVFLQKQPGQQEAAQKLARENGADMAQWLFLPVVARQDWVAVLNQEGQIQGFLQGDGF